MILLVEDDPGIRDCLVTFFHLEGRPIWACEDGASTLAWAQTNTPELVLLDITLPDMKGSVLAHELRRIWTHHVPILVITADGRIQEKSVESRADAYLQKPFDLVDLTGLIQQFIP